MMKIGYVLNTFPKLSERFILNEIKQVAKGAEVVVFSLRRPEQKIEMDTEGLKVYYMDRKWLKGVPITVKGMMGREELFNKSIPELYYNSIGKWFARMAKDEGLEMLHRHFATDPIVYYFAKELGVPYTISAHAKDIFFNARYRFVSEVLNKAARVITISQYNIDYMNREFGVDGSRMRIVHGGADSDKFKPPASEPKENHLLSIGRLVEKKGFEHGIRAVASLKDRYPDIQYSIVGDGPLRGGLQALINELGTSNYISLRGSLPDAELMELMNRAKIFIAPCMVAKDGDMDGLPAVITEAMAMGIPVVSTTISGIPEVIEDGVNGVLVEPDNTEALEKGIDRILSGKLDRRSLSANARKIIVDEFNVEKEGCKILDIFEGVVRSWDG